MKKITVLVALSICYFSNAQMGTSRAQAIPVQPQNSCTYSDYTTQGLETWYSFAAQSEKVAIELKSEKFGNDMAHVHHLSLYRGMDVNELKGDELPFNAESQKLKINLNAGNLVIGETYYLKAERKPHIDNCNKNTCTHNNFINPAQFKLCVENVYPYIPNDFNDEKALNAFSFHRNIGQVNDAHGNVNNEVLFYSKNTYPQLFLTDRSTSLLWSKIDSISTNYDSIVRVDINLVNSNINERILFSEENSSFSNYYTKNNQKGILGSKSFNRLIRQNIYNNIDWHFYNNKNGLKMYFVLNEGGQHSDIKFKFDGLAQSTITSSNGIQVSSPLGQIIFRKAIVYYVNPAGNNVPMPQSGKIIDNGDGTFGIEIVETYPSNRKLIIQIERDSPTREESYPDWSTYFGGIGADSGKGLDTDNQGNVFMIGSSAGGEDFPIVGEFVFQSTGGGLYLTKFSPFYELIWSTYINGVGGEGVAYDHQNNVAYVTGSGGTSFIDAYPLANSPNCFVENGLNNGLVNSIVARINVEFGSREWLTKFANNSQSSNNKIKVDNEGSVYVIGKVGSPGSSADSYIQSCQPTNGQFPLCNLSSPNAYQQGLVAGGLGDAFIAKFNRNLELVWSTKFGGNDREEIFDIAIDNINQYVYIVGKTHSEIPIENCVVENTFGYFPICNQTGNSNAYYSYNNQNIDGFIARFNFNGEMNWSTFFGGEFEETITGIEIDSQGNIILVGYTDTYFDSQYPCMSNMDNGFPICISNSTIVYNQNHFGNPYNDAFVTKFDKDINLIWSTRIGGGEVDKPTFPTKSPKVTIGSNDKIYIIGSTSSGSINVAGDYNSSFPNKNNPLYYYEPEHKDLDISDGIDNLTANDGYVLMFREDGHFEWGTYFGGKMTNFESDDSAEDIAVFQDNVYICGTTKSDYNFPLKDPNFGNSYFQPLLASASPHTDAFIAQLKLNNYANVKEVDNNQPIDFIVYPNPNNGVFNIKFSESQVNNYEIRLINQMGQVVFEKNLNSKTGMNNIQLNFNNLDKGIYYIQLNNTIKKVIIK